MIKSPNTSKIAKANYQNQDSILVVDTNLRILQNANSIVQLYYELRTRTQILQYYTNSTRVSIIWKITYPKFYMQYKI